jgi:putative transposase
VKTTGVGGERGYDGGKKVKGRKRHLLVDTEGLVLKAKVHVANMVDQEGIKPLLDGAKRSCSHAFHTCGWTLVTGAKKKAEAGWRRL